MQEVKVIIRHRGNIERMEYGEYTRYRPVDEKYYMVLHGIDPWISGYCVANGGWGECEECEDFGEERCLGTKFIYKADVERMLRDYQDQGFPWIEDDGEIVIDITGHEPHSCAEHPDSGCLVCHGGCMESHREE